MQDLAIIFIYTKFDDITQINYQSIVDNHPHTPVYKVCQGDFDDYHYPFLDLRPLKYWDGGEIWFWGSDNIFLYWYLSQNIRAKNYIIFEWDTYVNKCSVYDFYGKDTLENNRGILTPLLAEQSKDPWYYWFKFQADNKLIKNFYGYENFCCSTPLCGTVISDDCVNAIVEHITQYPFANKIYVETKFSTIAKYLNFTIKEIPNKRSYLSYDTNICANLLKSLKSKNKSNVGIFHPIKNTKTIKEFFTMSNEPIESTKITKAYYGIIADAKSAIQSLIDLGINEIEVNNTLGGDPAPGINKKLYLEYEKNGQLFTKEFDERSVLKIKDL
jgi:hypothetical protein